MPAVRLLVVDDSTDFLRAATMLLGLDDRLDVAGAVPTVAEALAFLDAHRVDLVLLDVNMPGVGGVEAAAEVRARHPHVVVVLCSTMTRDDALSGAARSTGSRRSPAAGAAPGGTATAGQPQLFLEKADLTPSALLDLWHSRAG